MYARITVIVKKKDFSLQNRIIGGRRLLQPHRALVQIQIVGPPKHGMREHGHEAGGDPPEEDRGLGEEQQGDGGDGQHGEHEALLHAVAPDDEGRVAEEIQEQPREHGGDEDDERGRVPQQAHQQRAQHHHRVVHVEIPRVRQEPLERRPHALRRGQGRRHHAPRPPRADPRPDPLPRAGVERRVRRGRGGRRDCAVYGAHVGRDGNVWIDEDEKYVMDRI